METTMMLLFRVLGVGLRFQRSGFGGLGCGWFREF